MEGKPGAEAEPRPANLVPLLINRATSGSDQLTPEMSRQSSVLHDACVQGVIRQVTVRTDAITGQPLDIVLPAEASTADFPAPGTVLQTPGALLLSFSALSAGLRSFVQTCTLSRVDGFDTSIHQDVELEALLLDADLPDAETKWRDLQPLVAFWMACSTVSFLSSLFWLPLGCLSGFLGIMGAFLMCNCQICFNFAMAVKVMFASPLDLLLDIDFMKRCSLTMLVLEQAMQTLASICMVLSGSVALVLLYTAIVIHCDRTQYSAKYCFRLVSTCVHLCSCMTCFPSIADCCIAWQLR